MQSKNLLPYNLFANEKLINSTGSDAASDFKELNDYQPDTIIISLNDSRPENSIKVQQATMERLKESIEKLGRKTSVIYCQANCFPQHKLHPISSIKTFVFLGVKPYNIEVIPSKFYTPITLHSYKIIVGNTIYQLDADAKTANTKGLKRKLWDALLS
jgi:hypothetical protein